MRSILRPKITERIQPQAPRLEKSRGSLRRLIMNHIKKNQGIVVVTVAAAFIIVAQFLMLNATLHRLDQASKPQPSMFRLVGDCPGGGNNC
jgi:TRAP-type uncharacterized transport system fused permease subunit